MYKGNLIKLTSDYALPINYRLVLSDKEVVLNQLLGKYISIEFTGKINCIECGASTKKSFAQGYCYKCFQTSPATEECILKPELCRAQLNEARNLDWAKENHLQPHIVYLAYSSEVKVGVTRLTQVPTRWIDQGADCALPFLKTPNRHIAGVAEVYLKQKYTDKTNWTKMLAQPQLFVPNLKEEALDAIAFLPKELRKYQFQSEEYNFKYPVNQYPESVTSVNLDKSPKIAGVLVGIKGQYLIFDSGEVMNVRRHNGYEVMLSSE